MKLKDKVVIEDRLGMFRGVQGTIIEEDNNRFRVAFADIDEPLFVVSYWFSTSELRKR